MEWLWDLLVNLHWGAVGQIIMIDILLGATMRSLLRSLAAICRTNSA